MEINLTLLVQIGHFFLAWLMIKKLLLEPALASIFAERNEHQAKVDTIKMLKDMCEQKNRYKQVQWKECQRQFAAGIPRELPTFHMLRRASLPEDGVGVYVAPTMTKKEIQEVAQVITKRIERIND